MELVVPHLLCVREALRPARPITVLRLFVRMIRIEILPVRLFTPKDLAMILIDTVAGYVRELDYFGHIE